MKYKNDREWSDGYIPTIKQIVAPHLIVVAPKFIDQKWAADLILMKTRGGTLACRIRRDGYAARYPYQFTIRWKRDNGVETEFSKIREGFADSMFYGHAVKNESTEINPWFLIDLDRFREYINNKKQREEIIRKRNLSWGIKDNGDGTSFIWFDLRQLDPNILIASSCNIPYGD